MMQGGRRLVPVALTILAIVLLWGMVAAFGPYPEHLFPSPRKVGSTLVELARSGSLWMGIVTTLRRLAIGFVISGILGSALAVLLVRWRAARQGMQPIMLGVQSLPGVAWVPLAILWFGYGEEGILFVTIAGSVFSFTLAIADAIDTVPRAYVRAARNMGAKRGALLLRVELPAALPLLLAGLKQGWAFAWRSLVSAEIVFATLGLGFLLNRGRELLDVAEVVAIMATILALGALFERGVFAVIENRVRRRWGLPTY